MSGKASFPEVSVQTDDYDDLWTKAAEQDDPVSRIEQIEELFRYDMAIVDVVKGHDGRIWLRTLVDEKGEATTERRRVSFVYHFLLFPDADAAKATLNDGFVPTIESYRKAEAVIVQTVSYDAGGDLPSGAHDYACRPIERQDIEDELMPYAQLRPGRRMVFGPLEDSTKLSRAESDGLYAYPVPADDVLAVMDHDRNWIGRFDQSTILGSGTIHLVACVVDEPGRYVQHRLDFDVKDEAAMRATLAARQAPTMDTYRLAKEIRRETIDHADPAGPMLIVDGIDADDLGETPTFESAAEHDEKWPQYAAKTKD
jgi:hypothetical protein